MRNSNPKKVVSRVNALFSCVATILIWEPFNLSQGAFLGLKYVSWGTFPVIYQNKTRWRNRGNISGHPHITYIIPTVLLVTPLLRRLICGYCTQLYKCAILQMCFDGFITRWTIISSTSSFYFKYITFIPYPTLFYF